MVGDLLAKNARLKPLRPLAERIVFVGGAPWEQGGLFRSWFDYGAHEPWQVAIRKSLP